MIENKNRSAEEAKSVEVAEESRELDWKSKSYIASMFMGDLETSMIYPFPFQDAADKAAGDEVCARVEAWCEQHLDGETIDREEVIPAHVMQGLAQLGLFGIKIPKKYGGLGMSQTNYCRILTLVARYCASTAATLSAHQSIGVPQPLKLFGTEEQKQKYLPRVAAGAVSAFALTEPTVGSDPANMHTVATPTEDGKHWILNGEKLWCTNGVIADIFVVMAQSPSVMVKGKERKQITAFIVEADTPGIEVLHRCHFMGIRAIENGLIRFTNVKVPTENILWGEGKGLRLALTTLNDGRLGIPAIAASSVRDAADFCNRWAKGRVQWGKAIGEHEASSEKVAFVNASAYALESVSTFAAALSDRGDVDIRMEAAAAKMFNTELAWAAVDTAVQLRGGRGYETAESLKARGEAAFPMERMLRDTRINRIVEGTTDIMHLFLAREALDKHLSVAGGLFKKGSFAMKLGVVLKSAVFYAVWYPKLWLGGLFQSFSGFDPRLADHLKWVSGQTRRLARSLFHRMIFLGPKLEMRQLTLNRLVDIGMELAVMGLVAARAQTELDRGDGAQVNTALHWLSLGRLRVDALFTALSHNADASVRALSKELLAQAEALPEAVTPDLKPLPRERGSDLTSGRQHARLAHQTPGANLSRTA